MCKLKGGLSYKLRKGEARTNISGCASASICGSASMVEQFATYWMLYESFTSSMNCVMIRFARSRFLLTVTRVYGLLRGIAM